MGVGEVQLVVFVVELLKRKRRKRRRVVARERWIVVVLPEEVGRRVVRGKEKGIFRWRIRKMLNGVLRGMDVGSLRVRESSSEQEERGSGLV